MDHINAHKRAENYAERVETLDQAMAIVNSELREFNQELVKGLIYSIKIQKGLQLTIQFHSGIVMTEEMDYYED